MLPPASEVVDAVSSLLLGRELTTRSGPITVTGIRRVGSGDWPLSIESVFSTPTGATARVLLEEEPKPPPAALAQVANDLSNVLVTLMVEAVETREVQ